MRIWWLTPVGGVFGEDYIFVTSYENVLSMTKKKDINLMKTCVSIVLPVNNGEKYLSESIESIILQTLKDWELIIVNDGSTDRSGEIIESYCKKDKRIRVIVNTENKGLPESLNIGFREAQGRFLTWTSDDNRYLPEALEHMYGFLHNHSEYKMVCANMYCIYEDDEEYKEQWCFDGSSMYISDSVGACFMYRREVLDTIGEYDPEMIYVEDYDYWLRILKQYGQIGHIDEYLYVYRRHGGSLTATKMTDIRKQHNRLMNREIDWIFDNIHDRGDLVWRLYIQLSLTGDVSAKVKEYISLYYPEILHDMYIDADKPFVLYGAGEMGDTALDNLEESRVTFFADKTPERYGGIKKGIPIISIKELFEIKDAYNIMITVGAKNMISVMRDLIDSGIDEFCSYEHYRLMTE